MKLPFNMWPDWRWNPTIPKLDWGNKSPEQWIKDICLGIAKMSDYKNAQTGAINANADNIDNCTSEYGDVVDQAHSLYDDVVDTAIDSGMYSLVDSVDQLHFGLSKDGHFLMYVLDWDDIGVSTGDDYDVDTYGRIMLSWNAASKLKVNQEPEAASFGIISG